MKVSIGKIKGTGIYTWKLSGVPKQFTTKKGAASGFRKFQKEIAKLTISGDNNER